jgi:RsiW-degrading membrane proteinase PrsW (M82 family)
MILLIAAAAPVCLLVFLVWHRDTEKEPPLEMFKAFLGGLLAIIMALLLGTGLQAITGTPPAGWGFIAYRAFLLAGVCEELAKYLVLYWLIWHNKAFDQHYDGILYAVLVSLGFALVENILYVWQGGLDVAALRAVLSVPAHALFAVLMGYYFSLARFHRLTLRTYYLHLALWWPVLLHGLFDFSLMALPFAVTLWHSVLVCAAFFAVVILLWRMSLERMAHHLERDHVDLVTARISP